MRRWSARFPPPNPPAGAGRTTRPNAADLPAAELFDRHGVAVYSLARAMLGDRVAQDLALDVLVEACKRGERSRVRLLVETHRRAVARLRDTDHAQDVAGPAAGWTPQALDGLDPLAAATLQLICINGYTISQAASHLDRPHGDVLRALGSGIDALNRRLRSP